MERPVRRNTPQDAVARSALKGAALGLSQPPEETPADMLAEFANMSENELSEALSVGSQQPNRNDYRTLLSQKADFGDDGFTDPELDQLNNPDATPLHDAPLIGGRGRPTEIFGEIASTMGRVSSPKLLAQASNFPTATQFRVWRWENGVPCALGAIDAEASEDDFIKQFYNAMPGEGDGRLQFKLRPVDIRGAELGQEFTVSISEHHSTLVKLRNKKEREAAKEQQPPMYPYGHAGGSQPIIVQPPPAGDNGSSQAIEEVGRLFESAVETERRNTDMYRQSLEEERARLRDEEKARAEERMSFAARSSDAVQKMTERMMAADRARSQEQLEAQGKQGQLLLSTLTTVFQQQQEAARAQAERLREADMSRLQMDREFFDRQRQLQEEQRLKEREEAQRRIEAERQRLELEQKRMEAQRAQELEMLRIESQRREADAERRRQSDKEELYARIEREKNEAMQRAEAAREERERWRVELDEKRRQDAQEWERKRAIEREEAERKEREYRDRADREQREFHMRMEQQKLEMEQRRMDAERRLQQEREDYDRKVRLEREEADRREQVRRDEMNREAERRREEVAVQMKQMEMASQRDREHQERLMHMSQLERESQREALAARERSETAARELAEKERNRQHSQQIREMELSKERDREHAERMISMQKAQTTGGFGQIGEMLGMETPELLTRIFSGGGNANEAAPSAWSDAIPKVIGSLADIGKAALATKMAMGAGPELRKPRTQPGAAPSAPGGQAQGASPQQQQHQVAPQPERPALPKNDPADPLVQIPTPEGMKIVPMSVAESMGFRPPPGMSRPGPQVDLPDQGSIPEPKPKIKRTKTDKAEEPKAKVDVAEQPAQAAQPSGIHPIEEGKLVDTGSRASAAGIKLIEVGKARKGIRALVEKLRKANEEEWQEHILTAIVSNIGIYHYIQAVTFYAAVAEAGADAELADKLVVALKSSEMVPSDMIYTENDYNAAKQAAGSAQ